MALDPQVVALAKAIRQTETGNKPVSGASGESGRYQFMPGTWHAGAAQYLGDSNAPQTLENENKVAYEKIKHWKDQGYNPGQVASLWNSGSPDFKGKVGVNKMGVKYDVPSYVQKVYGNYQKFKPKEIASDAPSALDVNSIEQPEKKPGLLKSIYDTTIGRAGAGGLAAMPGRLLSQLGVLKDTTDANESLGGLAEQTTKLIKQIPNETDPDRKARLEQMVADNQQTLAQGRATNRQTEKAILTPRDTISTAVNTGLLAASGSGNLAKTGILKGVEAFAPEALPAATKAVSAAKGLLPRAIEQAGIGAGFQASQNLAEGNPLGQGVGQAAAFGAALPVAGTAASQVGSKLKGIGNIASEKIINSLIKPLGKDLSYGKNPARGILAEGITANSLEDLANKVSSRRTEIGKQISEKVSASQKPVILSDAVKPLKEAITKAKKAPETNKSLISRLEGALSDVQGAIGPGRYYATPQQAFEVKKLVGDITKFTGNVSDDKEVNLALKQVYGRLKEKLNEAVPGLSPLNERYADLTSAEIAARYRDKIETRQNLVSLRGVGIGAGALVGAIASGGAAIPSIVAGLAGSQLDNLLGNAAVKTRVAQWLTNAGEKEKFQVFQNIPAFRNALERIFGKEPEVLKAIEQVPEKPLMLGAGPLITPPPKNLGSKMLSQVEARKAVTPVFDEGMAKSLKNITGKSPMASSAPYEGSIVIKTTKGQHFLLRKGYQPSKISAQEANELERSGMEIMSGK